MPIHGKINIQHSRQFSTTIGVGLKWHRPLYILIVDDHIDGAELLQMLFELECHHVAVALNAEDAFEMVKER